MRQKNPNTEYSRTFSSVKNITLSSSSMLTKLQVQFCASKSETESERMVCGKWKSESDSNQNKMFEWARKHGKCG